MDTGILYVSNLKKGGLCMANRLGKYLSSKAAEIKSKFEGVKCIIWRVDTSDDGVTIGIRAGVSFNDEECYYSSKSMLGSIEGVGGSRRYGKKCLSIELLDFPKDKVLCNVGTLC